MKNVPILMLLIMAPTFGWADSEIIKQEHTRLQDYHTAWGKGFDHLAPSLSSQTNADAQKWSAQPANEKHTDIVTANGYAWRMVHTNNQWQLMQAKLDGIKADWRRVSDFSKDVVKSLKINQNGDLFVLILDKATNRYSTQTASIHSGGENVTWDEPIPLAGNQKAAMQEWEKQSSSMPMIVNEFDLGKAAEFLAVSHSINQANTLVRYRISPELGMPYSNWSAPVAAGSLQLKKDGRFLQYQIMADESITWDELPQISITYTYPTSPSLSPDEKDQKNDSSSGFVEHNTIDPMLESDDLNQSNMEPEENENGQSNHTDMEKDVVSAGDGSPEKEKRDHGSSSNQQRDDSADSKQKEVVNQDKQDADEQLNQDEKKEQQSIDANSDKQEEDASDLSSDNDEQQEQNQQPDENPNVENPSDENPNQNKPSEQNDSTREPEFASPFNKLIGIPNQQPVPSQNEPQQEQPSDQEQNPTVEPSSQPQPADTENPQDQNNAEPESQSSEELNMPNNSGEGDTPQPGQSNDDANPTENGSGQPSFPNQNGSGNALGDEANQPPSNAGMPGNEAANQPPSGMPQEQGGAPGFQFPGMGGSSNGSAYQQKPFSPKGNHAAGSNMGNTSMRNSSLGNARTGNQNPHREIIASPTIALATPAFSPTTGLLKKEEPSTTSTKTAVPLAGGAGLLSILFWVKGKKRKTVMDVDPCDLEDADQNLLANAVDEFAGGEKSLYTLIPKRDDSVWDHAIAFDSSVTAAEIMDDRVITLHDDGCIRLDQQDNLHSKTVCLGKWDKQGITPQLASSGLSFFAAGLNVKGQINICQGKQTEKSYIEEQKPMPLPGSIHSLTRMNIKQNKLWLLGESFEKNTLLCASIVHGKVCDWKTVVPHDVPEGEIVGFSTSGKDLIAYATDDEPGIARIYQRDATRGGWELTAKCHFSGGQVCLCMDDKRCFIAEWLEGESAVSIHAFTRGDEGRFAGHYVNKVDLPFNVDITSSAFQNGMLILQGKQTTPKGETRMTSCGASIRKLLGVPIAVN